MANLSPKTDHLKSHQFKLSPDSSEPLGKPFAVRLPLSAEQRILSLPAKERSAFIRAAVLEKLQREDLMG